MIFYWVEKVSKSANELLIIGIILFVANTAYSHWLKLPSIPWHFNYIGFACFYMALGKYYKSHEQIIDNAVSNKMLLMIGIVYVLVIYFADLHIGFAGSPYVVDALFITTLGLILCVLISKRFLNNSRFLLFVGSNTLFYFAFHGKVYSLLQTVSDKIIAHIGMERSFCTDILWGDCVHRRINFDYSRNDS